MNTSEWTCGTWSMYVARNNGGDARSSFLPMGSLAATLCCPFEPDRHSTSQTMSCTRYLDELGISHRRTYACEYGEGDDVSLAAEKQSKSGDPYVCKLHYRGGRSMRSEVRDTSTVSRRSHLGFSAVHVTHQSSSNKPHEGVFEEFMIVGPNTS